MGEGEGAKRDYRHSVRRRQHTLRVVHNGNDDRIALRALEEGFVCIGWTVTGDLSAYETRAKMRPPMETALVYKAARSLRALLGTLKFFMQNGAF
jgi:hypothetical protein